MPDAARAAYGRRLPPASRQWNYVTDDGDLFKGGFDAASSLTHWGSAVGW